MTTKPVKPGPLKAAFKTDLAACWELARTLHPDHTPYAFVLYGVEGGARLLPQVLTDEGLTQVATRYVKEGYHDTLDEARKALRYSVADSPLFAELQDKVTNVTELFKPHARYLIDEEAAAYELLAKAAMAAFEELDEEGLFGKDPEREQLMLAIITEDTEKDWTKSSIKRLNPAAVFKRFEADTKIEGTWASSDAIAISPDGRSLYSSGPFAARSKQHKDAHELVAYDIAGMSLKRRWEFLFPGSGDWIRTITCASDGKTILVMRVKHTDQGSTAILMRFGWDRNTAIEQVQLKGEPMWMAVAGDGSRVAVVMHDMRLHILDGKLSELNVMQLPVPARGAMFLRSGDLLLATGGGILRMDREFKLTETPSKEACLQITADDAESLLVVSFDFQLAGTTGFKLLRLPSLELAGEFELPDLQVHMAVISPDGRHAALHAQKSSAYKYFTVVCETGTGREIARRKAGTTRELKFLPDNRTLAIAGSGFTASEPVTLWRVPGL